MKEFIHSKKLLNQATKLLKPDESATQRKLLPLPFRRRGLLPPHIPPPPPAPRRRARRAAGERACAAMGQGASCGRPSEEVDFFGAAQSGDLARLAAAVRSRPSLLGRTTLFDRLSALHIAAAHGHLQVS